MVVAIYAWLVPVVFDWGARDDLKPLRLFAPALVGAPRYTPVQRACEHQDERGALQGAQYANVVSHSECAYPVGRNDFVVALFASSTPHVPEQLMLLTKVNAASSTEALRLARSKTSELDRTSLMNSSLSALSRVNASDALNVFVLPNAFVLSATTSYRGDTETVLVVTDPDLSDRLLPWRTSKITTGQRIEAIARVDFRWAVLFAREEMVQARVVLFDDDSSQPWKSWFFPGDISWLWWARVTSQPAHALAATLMFVGSILAAIAFLRRSYILSNAQRELAHELHRLYPLGPDDTVVVKDEIVAVTLPGKMRTLAASVDNSGARAVLVHVDSIEREGAMYRDAARPNVQASLLFEGDADLAPALMEYQSGVWFRRAILVIALGLILARIVLFDLP